MKLVTMHGLSPFKRLAPRAVSSLLAPCQHRAEMGGISRAAVLRFGRQTEGRTAKQYTAGGKSNAGGLPCRRWQHLRVF